MNFRVAKNQRVGQSIFNFLEWLRVEKKYNSEQSVRMADPFYISDTKWGRLYKEFLDSTENKK